MQFSLEIHKHATFILVCVSVFTFKTQTYSKKCDEICYIHYNN